MAKGDIAVGNMMSLKSKLLLPCVIGAAVITLSGVAQATDVLFTISGDGNNFSFRVPEKPTITSYNTGNFFYIYSVDVNANGTDVPNDTLFFTSSSYGGGGGVTDGKTFVASGAQYYTGSESAPTFNPATYTGQTGNELTGLTVTVALPEPATWTLMLVGFGGLGCALRARRGRAAA